MPRRGRRHAKKPLNPHREDDVFEEEEKAVRLPDEIAEFAGKSAKGVALDLGSDFEDEEIDEDEAWDEDDYRKYGPAMGIDQVPEEVRQRAKQLVRQAPEISLTESDEEDEDEDDEKGGGRLLSELLDEDEPTDNQIADYEEGSGLEGEGDEIEEELAMSDDEEEEDEEENDGEDDDKKYASMMSAIGGQLRTDSAKKRKAMKSVERFLPESEYSILPKHTKQGQEKLTLSKLVGTLKDTTNFGDVKQRLMDLQQGSTPLVAPLPKVERDRMTRSEAYAIAQSDLTEKWQTTVIKNKSAPQLAFPFNEAKAPDVKTGAIVESLVPQTSLELGIADILRQSGIQEERIQSFADLAPQELTEEDIKEREGQLSKMRHLMFYHELKMKRRKKIKSKKYHAILKREKMKKKLSIAELELLDKDLAKKEQEKLEWMRIRERVTQRHRNKGNWAKNQLKRTEIDKSTRQLLSEQLQLRNQLLKKQRSMNANEDDDDVDVDVDDVDALDRRLAELDAEPEPEFPKKGLMSLEFMHKGFRKSGERAKAEDKLLDKQYGFAGNSDDSDDDDENGNAAVPRGKAKVALPDVTMLDSSQQLEMVGFSAARRVKASGPMSVQLAGEGPASVSIGDEAEKGTKTKKENSKKKNANDVPIKPIFEMEPFPEVKDATTTSDSNKGSQLHSINKRDVSKLFQEKEPTTTNDEQQNNNRKNKRKRAPKSEKEEKTKKNNKQQPQEQKRQKKSREEEEKEVKIRLNVGEDDDYFAVKQQVEGSNSDDVDNEDKIPLSTASNRFRENHDAPVPDKENPWMQKSKVTEEIERTTKKRKSADVSDRVAKEQRRLAEGVRDVKEQDLKIDLSAIIDANAERTAAVENHLNLMASDKKEQKKLIQLAFANDDVVAEFEKEKKDVMDADNPPEQEDLGLPGWGSWVGEGITHNKKRNSRQRDGTQQNQPATNKKKMAPIMQQPMNKKPRKDAQLTRVIINERRDKKAAKFTASAVPFPFKNKEQYETVIRNPVGKLWNTEEIYQEAIQPRIKVKMGANIMPLDKPLPASETKQGAKKPRKNKKNHRNNNNTNKN